MEVPVIPDWAMEMLAGAPVARLAFLDSDDHPRVLPVTFALAGDAVWSAIDEKPKRSAQPARVRYLRRRPEAALCVDHYEDDWSRLAWVQLLGRVSVIELETPQAGATGAAEPGAGTLEALEALAAKYPQYRERTPPGPLLRLGVERALHWRAAGG